MSSCSVRQQSAKATIGGHRKMPLGTESYIFIMKSYKCWNVWPQQYTVWSGMCALNCTGSPWLEYVIGVTVAWILQKGPAVEPKNGMSDVSSTLDDLTYTELTIGPLSRSNVWPQHGLVCTLDCARSSWLTCQAWVKVQWPGFRRKAPPYSVTRM